MAVKTESVIIHLINQYITPGFYQEYTGRGVTGDEGSGVGGLPVRSKGGA